VIEQFDHAPNEIGRPTVRVGLNGSWIGANRGGEHHLCVDWQSRPFWMPMTSVAASSLTAEPGKTYFFRARIIPHYGSIRTMDFDLVNNDEGQMLAAKSPRAGFHQQK